MTYLHRRSSKRKVKYSGDLGTTWDRKLFDLTEFRFNTKYLQSTCRSGNTKFYQQSQLFYHKSYIGSTTKYDVMKNLLFLCSLILLIGLSSCSKSNELDVSADDIQLLQAYTQEADAMIDVVSDIDGNVSSIFTTSVIINPCIGNVQFVNGGVADEATQLLNDMVDKMGFNSALEVHNWMVDAGRVMYDIKQANLKNFDTDREIMTELACAVAPEIMTRNSENGCYKDNLVALFIGTLEAGDNYGTRIATTGTKQITEAGCSGRGSSFNKIWLYMKNSYDCE